MLLTTADSCKAIDYPCLFNLTVTSTSENLLKAIMLWAIDVFSITAMTSISYLAMDMDIYGYHSCYQPSDLTLYTFYYIFESPNTHPVTMQYFWFTLTKL